VRVCTIRPNHGILATQHARIALKVVVVSVDFERELQQLVSHQKLSMCSNGVYTLWYG